MSSHVTCLLLQRVLLTVLAESTAITLEGSGVVKPSVIDLEA